VDRGFESFGMGVWAQAIPDIREKVIESNRVGKRRFINTSIFIYIIERLDHVVMPNSIHQLQNFK